MQCREDFTSIFTNKDYIINIAMFNDITNVRAMGFEIRSMWSNLGKTMLTRSVISKSR